jgi:hypothetical protein
MRENVVAYFHFKWTKIGEQAKEVRSLDRLRAVHAAKKTITAPRCALCVVAPDLIRLPLHRGEGG